MKAQLEAAPTPNADIDDIDARYFGLALLPALLVLMPFAWLRGEYFYFSMLVITAVSWAFSASGMVRMISSVISLNVTIKVMTVLLFIFYLCAVDQLWRYCR